MADNKAELNLARKWRPSKFSEVVGQSLSIKMLKNGLYLNKIFPLYIFSGQRGCGKTSTARIFASALNCASLTNFQQSPKEYDVPCGKCSSCNSMLDKSHTDFIEMDAASHTGVDNVRQILESASFVSISGGYKIYLIDEAHMLSKAAFNAFLKVLEEPPVRVCFILATTELHKIPETVRSRAFQVFFNAINSDNLQEHLKIMCESENIKIDDSALHVLIAESGGSARDAINLLEQVRLLSDTITSEVVLSALGKIAEIKLYELYNMVLDQNPEGLLILLSELRFETLSPQSLWDMMLSLSRAIVWSKYGLAKLPSPFEQSASSVKKIAAKCSIRQVNIIMQLFLEQEELFLKTTQKHLFLENILLQLCSNKVSSPEATNISQKATNIEPQSKSQEFEKLQAELSLHSDHLIATIFKQAKLEGEEGGKIKIRLANNSMFLQDKVYDSLESLSSVIKKYVPNFVAFEFLEAPKVEARAKESVKNMESKFLDLSNSEKWPKANLLKEQFSGKMIKPL